MITLVLIVLAGCSNGEGVFFRSSEWGMDKEEVKESEGMKEPFLDGDEVLTYREELAGYDAQINYYFDEGLVRGYYKVNKNDLIEEYTKEELNEALNTILDSLIDQHGEPTENNQSDNLYIWELDNTIITVSLSSSGDSNYLTIGYSEKDFYETVLD